MGENNKIKKKFKKTQVHIDLYYKINHIAKECNTKKVRIHLSELSNHFCRTDTTIVRRLKALKRAKMIKFKILLNNAVLVTPLHSLEDEQKEFQKK